MPQLQHPCSRKIANPLASYIQIPFIESCQVDLLCMQKYCSTRCSSGTTRFTHTHTTIYLLIIHKPFIVPTVFDHRSQHFSNFECFHILYLSCSAVRLTLTISTWSKQSRRCQILIYSCYLKCVIHQDKFTIGKTSSDRLINCSMVPEFSNDWLSFLIRFLSSV